MQTDHKHHEQCPEHSLQHCHQGDKQFHEVQLVKSKPYSLVDDTEYNCIIHIPNKDIGWLGKSSSSEEIILCYLLLSGYSSSISTSRIKIKMKSNSRNELMNSI